jgi:hypothetical protein
MEEPDDAVDVWVAGRHRATEVPAHGRRAVASASALPYTRSLLAADVAPTVPASGKFPLVKFPEKTDLILLTDRPPTSRRRSSIFREDITSNDAFSSAGTWAFVPTRIDPGAF